MPIKPVMHDLSPIVAYAPRIIVSRPATIFLAVIEMPGSDGVWELFDAASFEECWLLNRIAYLPANDAMNVEGRLLLPAMGVAVRSGLTLASLPRGASAVFKTS